MGPSFDKIPEMVVLNVCMRWKICLLRYPFPIFKNVCHYHLLVIFQKKQVKSQTYFQVSKPKVETTALDSTTALPRSVSIQNNKCLHFPHISKVNFNLSYGVDSLYMWLLRTIKEIYRFFSKVCQCFFYSPFIHLC